MSSETQPLHQPPFEVPTVEEMGALLPQYSFVKLAAFGGMGAVYKARQESLDRPVAIKILPPAFGAEKEFAERFKSEARAMAKLSHSNIVAVYDFGITREAHLYLVMEWVEGPTLHEMIQKGAIPVKKVGALVMQLCDALSYAHNHRILHRDIKPGNIMVNQDDQVKVADFGLARAITGEAEENPYGTPEYAAPEILGKGAVDQRVDIFAAGVVLYEMLTGRVPKTPRRSVTEYAPLSPAWDQVIDSATHPDPEKRFMDAQDLRAHIANLLKRAEAVTAVPVVVTVVEDDGPKPKRGLTPFHYAVIGAVAAIVLSVVFGMLFRTSPADKSTRTVRAKVKKTEDNEERAKKKKEIPAKMEPKAEPVVVAAAAPVPEPPLEPEKKKVKEEPMVAAAAAPAPTPEPAAVPAPMAKAPEVPKPEDPVEAIQRLEEADPELAGLISAFENEWSADADISTESELKELHGKYIPALQRSLPGLLPEQRDAILSEISHVANRQPLKDPQDTWPPALHTLRQAYNSQAATIQAAADAAGDKRRSAQCELLLAKAKERDMAGNLDGARRAEAVAACLAKLGAPPSLRALKQGAAVVANENDAR